MVTIMKIYNEKEQAEQGKILEKKDTRMWNGAKSSVQGSKWIKRCYKESGDLKARSQPRLVSSL